MTDLLSVTTELVRQPVSKLHLNMPWEREELVKELEKETWIPHGMVAPVGHNPWEGYRYKVLNPSFNNKKLTELSYFLRSDEFKRQMINHMYQSYYTLDVTWGMGPDQMYECSDAHGEFTKDLPGLVNDIHCDYRKLIATGMVYLTETDNPDASTYFYQDINRTEPIRMTTNFGDGWWHANSHNTWHEGRNATDTVRYSILLGLTINVTKVEHNHPTSYAELRKILYPN